MTTPYTLFDTPTEARMSAEEYIDHPLSEQKSDLIAGVFVMALPASFFHEDLMLFIATTMRIFVAAKNLGKVMPSNVAYELDAENVFQPDVSFIRAERVGLAQKVYFPGSPDIAVEVVSPSSRHYDEIEKKIIYAQSGVREYWLIDPLSQRATFFTNNAGTFEALASDGTIIRSQVLDGYWLDTTWLFPKTGQTMPSELEVARLQGILEHRA